MVLATSPPASIRRFQLATHALRCNTALRDGRAGCLAGTDHVSAVKSRTTSRAHSQPRLSPRVMRGPGERGVPAPHAPQPCLLDGGDDVLRNILSFLPCDDLARVATLSRRLAALAALPQKRLTLWCSRARRVPDHVRERLVRTAGDALRELDVSPGHPEEPVPLPCLLPAALRPQLTVLRCTSLGVTALDAGNVLSTLEHFPHLRCLETSVFVHVDSNPDSSSRRLVAALPRLRIRRLNVGASGHQTELDSDAVAALSADFVALFQRCSEVLFSTFWPNAGSRAAFERALSTLQARGCSTAFFVDTFGFAPLGHASQARLAAQPRVVGLAASAPEADTLHALLDALAAPGCGVRRLSLRGASFDAHAGHDSPSAKLFRMLRSGALPLESLSLCDCSFSGTDGARDGFAHLCSALASVRTLTHLSLRGGAPFGARDAAALALLLRANRSLRTLDVRAVFNEAAESLAGALAMPRTKLERLYLSDVVDAEADESVGQRVADAFADALRVNTRLRELHLGLDEPVGSFAWSATTTNTIWTAVSQNTTLRYVTLPYHVHELDAHGVAMHELHEAAMYAECPRVAHVRFGPVGEQPSFAML